MMKKILNSMLAAMTLAAMHTPVYAATTDNDFTVSVALTSQCQASNSGSQTIDFGTYTAFQASAVTPAGVGLTFNCTRGFAPTSVTFDATNGAASGEGVLNGLNYSLSTGAATTTNGTAATATAGGIGTADAVSYTVTGTMAAGQAGTCTTATCAAASHTRTLIVTF